MQYIERGEKFWSPKIKIFLLVCRVPNEDTRQKLLFVMCLGLAHGKRAPLPCDKFLHTANCDAVTSSAACRHAWGGTASQAVTLGEGRLM